MKPVKLILDHTAIVRYADPDEIAVGELIAEISDEGAMFAVPALSLAEVARMFGLDAVERVEVLAQHPNALVVDLPAWREVGFAARVYGSIERAGVALHASVRGAYVVTATPELYPGLPTVEV